MAIVAGSYAATYNNSTLGMVEDGFEIEETPLAELVRATDTGQSIRDGVYTGKNVTIDMVLLEWNLAGVGALWKPWATNMGSVGGVGRQLSDLASQLVLTSNGGGNQIAAGANVIVSLTAAKAIAAPNFPVRWLMDARPRKLPVRLMLLPTTVDNDLVNYVTAVS